MVVDDQWCLGCGKRIVGESNAYCSLGCHAVDAMRPLSESRSISNPSPTIQDYDDALGVSDRARLDKFRPILRWQLGVAKYYSHSYSIPDAPRPSTRIGVKRETIVHQDVCASQRNSHNRNRYPIPTQLSTGDHPQLVIQSMPPTPCMTNGDTTPNDSPLATPSSPSARAPWQFPKEPEDGDAPLFGFIHRPTHPKAGRFWDDRDTSTAMEDTCGGEEKRHPALSVLSIPVPRRRSGDDRLH